MKTWMICRVFAIAIAATCAVAARADPATWRAEGWVKTDFARTSIDWSDILSGGPPKDGIPSIDQPKFVAIADDKDLAAVEPVIGLEIGGDARAYPLRVLIWHEIVNDTVGGTPVTVTYCPLCNSAIVFDRRSAGRVLDFGTTGKLRSSDLVMYDRQTESWWQQFTGEALAGELLGTKLKLVPSRLESFAQFKMRHPEGKLLVPADPAFRPYGSNPYAGYDTSVSPFLYRGDLPEGLEPMARVAVARREGGKPVIVLLEALRKAGTLKVTDVEFSWTGGQSSAVDTPEIAKGRDVGTVDAAEVVAGGLRRQLTVDMTFAFVAYAFHPDVAIAGR